MAYNNRVTGTLVKEDGAASGYFSCNVDIPDSWAEQVSEVLFDGGSFDTSKNTITYKAINIDFPETIGDLPDTTPSHNYPLNNYNITLTDITATCTVVVLGRNPYSGKKTGTVTNSTPKIGTTR